MRFSRRFILLLVSSKHLADKAVVFAESDLASSLDQPVGKSLHPFYAIRTFHGKSGRITRKSPPGQSVAINLEYARLGLV
jgi:hypothetical protein